MLHNEQAHWSTIAMLVIAFLSISLGSNSSINLHHKQVLETAQEVASLPASATPLPYDQVKDQCEALVTCKLQKLSVLRSFQHQQETKAIVVASDGENKSTSIPDLVRLSIMLPLASPLERAFRICKLLFHLLKICSFCPHKIETCRIFTELVLIGGCIL